MQSLLYLRLKGAEVGERKHIALEICNLFLNWYRENVRAGIIDIQFIQTDEYKITHDVMLNLITLHVADINVYLDYNPIEHTLTV
jgi:hypothetical protein